MRARLWGTRGSLAVAGPEFFNYGGNTSCVEVRTDDDHLVVLDAGTGLRRLGDAVEPDLTRVDLLLTHFHMDHLFGFGFFSVLFRPDVDVHVWGPASDAMSLRARLNRYLSPPLFPVRLPDLPSRVTLHHVPFGTFDLPSASVTADLVCHPGRTVGYRVTCPSGSVTYLPDHEPALGWEPFPTAPAWTSGLRLAEGADLLIHDAQYDDEEYRARVGWGHSTAGHALEFARMAGVDHLVGFHHDPGRDDYAIEALFASVADRVPDGMALSVAKESSVHELLPR